MILVHGVMVYKKVPFLLRIPKSDRQIWFQFKPAGLSKPCVTIIISC